MLVRIAVALAALLAASPAWAGDLKGDEARRFIAGKLFAFHCFEGTSGAGRIYHDGSVAGSIRFRGSGQTRFVVLPPGTLHMRGDAWCASVKGVMFQPCFDLARTDDHSFRGAVSGLGFAYCNFTRRPARAQLIRASAPMSIGPVAAAQKTE
jgi:hypothetical protein